MAEREQPEVWEEGGDTDSADPRPGMEWAETVAESVYQKVQRQLGVGTGAEVGPSTVTTSGTGGGGGGCILIGSGVVS